MMHIKQFFKVQILLPALLSHTMLLSNQLMQIATSNDTSKIQKMLQNQGFKKVFFTTSDNFKLCGFFLDQSDRHKNIRGTIIYCAGFYPGIKEGMASFYALFANQPYNFLIFDARGHHESDGKLFSYQSLKNYGNHEYRDVIAAIDFVQNYNQQRNISPDIIMHAICSGAFHCVKAINHLQQCNQHACVKGIIFDSGWLELSDIVEPTLWAETKKQLTSWYLSWFAQPIGFLITRCYRALFKQSHATIPGITQQISQIFCPIFFIHCLRDPYVPSAPIMNLVQQISQASSWWIDHDSHTNFHTLNPELYTQQITDFLKKL